MLEIVMEMLNTRNWEINRLSFDSKNLDCLNRRGAGLVEAKEPRREGAAVGLVDRKGERYDAPAGTTISGRVPFRPWNLSISKMK